MLLKLWFDAENSGEIWYCGTKVQMADLQIRLPLNITLEAFSTYRSHWKASEYRAWLLFYSVSVVCSIDFLRITLLTIYY